MVPSSEGAIFLIMQTYAIPAIVTIFSLVIIVLSLQLDLSPEMIVGDSLQPRAFPIALMLINLILAVFLVLQYRKDPPKPVSFEGLTTWGSMALFGVFYVLTTYIDMMIAIAVVVFAMCYLWGERRLIVALAISILTPSTVFLLFDMVLRVRFPRGLFTNWYYG